MAYRSPLTVTVSGAKMTYWCLLIAVYWLEIIEAKHKHLSESTPLFSVNSQTVCGDFLQAHSKFEKVPELAHCPTQVSTD